MKKLCVFLASSRVLNEERKEIENWISRKNDSVLEYGIYLRLVIWEKLTGAFSTTRKQEEFNEHVVNSEIFICLVHDRVGEFTNEEFKKAYESFRSGNFPRLLLVYFKNTPIIPSNLGQEFQTVLDLKEEIRKLGQLWRAYSTVEELLFQLTQEFDAYLNKLKSPRVRNAHSSLPNMPYFVGRGAELGKIADALASESRGWGIMIDGPGGIGKTSLAIIAAHQAPEDDFPIKIFLSAKITEIVPDGKVSVLAYALADFEALISQLAVELGAEDIKQIPVSQRTNAVRGSLSEVKALLILDNVESFESKEADQLFQFLNRLPHSCKAIVTSRRRGTNIGANVMRLDRLQLNEGVELIDELAGKNPTLARASRREREDLYGMAGGNPLIIKWVCGQLGCHGIRTIKQACALLKSAPPDNDPLEFILGNLLDTFDPTEIAVLSALTYFSEPAELDWIAVLAQLPREIAKAALDRLTDRALLETNEIQEQFFLPTLTATFLRRVRPETVEQSGDRLLKSAYALVEENGDRKYQRFPRLETQWLSISTALHLIQQSDNIQLQWFCDGISTFLDFSGRQDELLSLYEIAERKAANAKAFNIAATRAYQVGCIFFARKEVGELSAAASRCEDYCEEHLEQVNLRKSQDAMIRMGKQEQAMMSRLRGLIQELNGDHLAAKEELLKAQDLHKAAGQNRELVIVMNDLALLHLVINERFASERYLSNALEIAKEFNFKEEILICLRNLARLKHDSGELSAAQFRAREGIHLAQELNCDRMIEEFVNQLSESTKG